MGFNSLGYLLRANLEKKKLLKSHYVQLYVKPRLPQKTNIFLSVLRNNNFLDHLGEKLYLI